MTKIGIKTDLDEIVKSLTYKQKVELHKKLGQAIGKNQPVEKPDTETNYPFDKFWNEYPVSRRIDKMKCRHFWYKLSENERREAYEYMLRYKKCTEGKYIKYVSRYLKDYKWKDIEHLKWAEKKMQKSYKSNVTLNDLRNERT